MSKKILWIEDDYYHLQGLIRPLLDLGFIIDYAESYNEALESLKNWQIYDLIILDLLLPNMQEKYSNEKLEPYHYGKKLFYHMKELGVNKPILIISIVQFKDIINELLNNGASMHLEKIDLLPFQVKEAICSLLDKK